MNVLAHRNIGQVQVTGTVEVNSHPIGIDINALSAYIQQEDLFIGTLTVREHLAFQVKAGKHLILGLWSLENWGSMIIPNETKTEPEHISVERPLTDISLRRTTLISGHLVVVPATYKNYIFTSHNFFWFRCCPFMGGSTVQL